MAGSYVNTSFRMGYSGYAWLVPDDGTSSSIAPQHTSLQSAYSDGISFLPLIDNSQVVHNDVLGVRLGTLAGSGIVSVDRGLDVMINTGFGPRTSGTLKPWLVTILNDSTATPFTQRAVWLQNMRIDGQWATQGSASAIAFSYAAISTDPDNRGGAPAVSTPAITGVTGVNNSTFANSSLTNNSTTTYDGIRGFSLDLANQLVVIPAADKTYFAYRLAAGCIPGEAYTSTLTLTQLVHADNPLPMTVGTYPFLLNIESPDGIHNCAIVLSARYTSFSQSRTVEGLLTNTIQYRLYGGTGDWPVIANYS